MKLLTKAIEAKLRKNHEENAGEPQRDFKPALKLFTPWGACTWLITELDENGIMFGLCDLGMGFPELGYVSLAELKSVEGPFGLRIERDMWFTATKTLTEYAEEARHKGRIAA